MGTGRLMIIGYGYAIQDISKAFTCRLLYGNNHQPQNTAMPFFFQRGPAHETTSPDFGPISPVP